MKDEKLKNGFTSFSGISNSRFETVNIKNRAGTLRSRFPGLGFRISDLGFRLTNHDSRIPIHRSLFTFLMILMAAQLLALKPSAEYNPHPDMFALIHKDLEVITSDRLSIACWFFPAQDMPETSAILAARNEGILPEYSAAAEPKPTIVVANGDAGNMSNQINFVVGFCPWGYNIVLFDWRGFGASSAWEAASDQLCYKEYLWDYAAVLDAVFEQPEVDTTRVAVYGGSTGAYLSFAAAAADERVDFALLRAILTDFEDVLVGLRAAKPERNLQAPAGYPEKLFPINIAPDFKRPVLLIVGEDDSVTPLWMSEKIYSLLPGKKELWIVPEAEHGGEKGPVYSDFERFTQKVDGFLSSQSEEVSSEK
ncbi:MAG: alpha/beta fold hydrolase [Candidatus Cloacimonetes bacterium]|nr:alpha/beta fold hydrolase [Candidatus Cloacimonadota bacterium]